MNTNGQKMLIRTNNTEKILRNNDNLFAKKNQQTIATRKPKIK